MIIVKNKIVPFKGYSAMTVWPFVFCREDMSKETLNHEKIHGKQQLELLLIIFYIIYFLEWVFKGYYKISFEKEAYSKQQDYNYLNNRKLFSMWR